MGFNTQAMYQKFIKKGQTMNVAMNQYCFNHSLKCTVLIVWKLSLNLNCEQFKFFFLFYIFLYSNSISKILFEIFQKFVHWIQYTSIVLNIKITKRTGIKKLKNQKDGFVTQYPFLLNHRINKWIKLIMLIKCFLTKVLLIISNNHYF